MEHSRTSGRVLHHTRNACLSGESYQQRLLSCRHRLFSRSLPGMQSFGMNIQCSCHRHEPKRTYTGMLFSLGTMYVFSVYMCIPLSQMSLLVAISRENTWSLLDKNIFASLRAPALSHSLTVSPLFSERIHTPSLHSRLGHVDRIPSNSPDSGGTSLPSSASIRFI